MKRLVCWTLLLTIGCASAAAAQLPDAGPSGRGGLSIAPRAGVAIPGADFDDIASTGLRSGIAFNFRVGASRVAVRFALFQDQFGAKTLATGERYEPTLRGYGAGLLWSPGAWWLEPYLTIVAGQMKVEVSGTCTPGECSVGLPTFADDDGAYVSGTFGVQRTFPTFGRVSALAFGEATAQYTFAALTEGNTTQGFWSFVPFEGGLGISVAF